MNRVVATHLAVGLVAVIVGSFLSVSTRYVYDREVQVQRVLDKQRPVVVDAKITEGFEKDGKLYVRVIGNKVRDCEDFISITSRYGKSEAKIRFMDDREADGTFKIPDSNPPGLQDFGYWEISPSPKGETLIVETVHRCQGDLVVTRLGEFQQEDYMK